MKTAKSNSPALSSSLADHVVWFQVDELKVAHRNARTHTSRQIAQIAASIQAFGFTNPVLIDETNTILAGHGRLAAAKRLGMDEVPTLRLESLSSEQKRAYVIADNRLAELAGWDKALLTIELMELIELDHEFNIELTGFTTGEIDILIDGVDAADKSDPADALPPIDRESPSVSRVGDLWSLGRHRLLCSDATHARSYELLLDGERVQMVFADPPYNVPIDGHVSGNGRARHKDFLMATGEMSEAEFTSFLTVVFRHLADHSVDGSIHFQCMDWRHLGEILAAGKAVYSELKNMIVWVKSNGGMGSFYRSQHELVFAFKNGTAPHLNNFGLGESGRYRTNVWSYPGANAFKPGRDDELAMHPTVKPAALVGDAIRDCSKRNGLILDPFTGSGTTIIAAERTGRVARTMELDPHYVDVAIRRWEEWTGERAIHAERDVTFEEVSANRGISST